jgi:hypothetical protein
MTGKLAYFAGYTDKYAAWFGEEPEPRRAPPSEVGDAAVAAGGLGGSAMMSRGLPAIENAILGGDAAYQTALDKLKGLNPYEMLRDNPSLKTLPAAPEGIDYKKIGLKKGMSTGAAMGAYDSHLAQLRKGAMMGKFNLRPMEVSGMRGFARALPLMLAALLIYNRRSQTPGA